MIINKDNKNWREVHKININEEFSQEELQKIANDLEQFKSDHEYLDKHTDTILKIYAEQWVAVYKGVIVAHNKDFDKFLKELDENEIRQEPYAYRFFTRKKITWILQTA